MIKDVYPGSQILSHPEQVPGMKGTGSKIYYNAMRMPILSFGDTR
jgi:hypothetical protein